MMPKHFICIKSKTCLDNSNSLFDNNSDNYKNTQINGCESFVIKRKENGDCYFSVNSSGNNSALISVICIDKDYYIDNCAQISRSNFNTDILNANWIPVRYTNEHSKTKNSHKLCEGDAIKVGRLIFKIKRISKGVCDTYKANNHCNVPILNDHQESFSNKNMKTSNKILPEISSCNYDGHYDPKISLNIQTVIKEVNYFDKDQIVSTSSFDKTNYTCRICLNYECNYEDPLISPCNCSGTMKFIHLSCLREWLKSKMKLK